jgi:hypothetical protein
MQALNLFCYLLPVGRESDEVKMIRCFFVLMVLLCATPASAATIEQVVSLFNEAPPVTYVYPTDGQGPDYYGYTQVYSYGYTSDGSLTSPLFEPFDTSLGTLNSATLRLDIAGDLSSTFYAEGESYELYEYLYSTVYYDQWSSALQGYDDAQSTVAGGVIDVQTSFLKSHANGEAAYADVTFSNIPVDGVVDYWDYGIYNYLYDGNEWDNGTVFEAMVNDWDGYANLTLTYDYDCTSAECVPEPATGSLFGLASLCLLGLRRRLV